MRDRQFAAAKAALAESVQDKTTIPESFRLVGKNVLYGKSGKVHRLLCSVPLPLVGCDHANLRVLGGRKVLKNRELEVNSWDRNFRNWMTCFLGATDPDDANFQDGELCIKDTGNNIRTKSGPVMNYRDCEKGTFGAEGYCALTGTSTSGIVVGTNSGSTPEQEDGYALDTQIAHGMAAGEFWYAEHPKPLTHTWDSPNLSCTWTRYFDNFEAGAGSIDVEEFALYSRIWIDGTWYNVMMERTVLDDALAVPFRAQVAVSYEFSHEYDVTDGFLRNFHNAVVSQAMSSNIDDVTFENGKLSVKNVAGSILSPVHPVNFHTMNSLQFSGQGYAGYNSDLFGILIGSGNTAVSIDDYNMASIIGHNGVDYAAGVAPSLSWADPTLTVTHARTFTNNGGSVTVRELGLSGHYYWTGTHRFLLLWRKVISDIEVANAETLLVTLQFGTEYE